MVYTICMGLVFLYMHTTFSQLTPVGRDMVYYNEQRILLEGDIENGMEREQVEQRYGCQILLRSDPGYEILLQEALQRDALLFDYYDGTDLAGKIIWNEERTQYEAAQTRLYHQTVFLWSIVLGCGYALLAVIYLKLVRPFHSLQRFSMQVAKGNLDFPLPVRRSHYFGAFTESFDLMREELKRARESEYLANQSKKELLAELSHDIKTPVATIQAACEVIPLKEKNPDTLDKVALIAAKARVIQKLVDNLFHATLEELTVLKVEPVAESSLCIPDMFRTLENYGGMKFTGNPPECLVYMDKLRLQQVIDNCLNNAWKYAGTEVTVSFGEQENGIKIGIRDEGDGVPEDELPLILEKFYRGSNTKGKEGSGLGLYLAKSFMEQMNGGLEYYNENGFVVQLFLQKV